MKFSRVLLGLLVIAPLSTISAELPVVTVHDQLYRLQEDAEQLQSTIDQQSPFFFPLSRASIQKIMPQIKGLLGSLDNFKNQGWSDSDVLRVVPAIPSLIQQLKDNLAKAKVIFEKENQ